MSNWNDHVVGDRMTVDQEFSERVRASAFSSQEWGLIMTATEFEIENPGSDDARIVANTDNLPQMMPELENIRNQMPGGGGGRGGSRGGGGGGGGLFGNIKDALGLDGSDDVDEARLAEARELTQEYAEKFQQHLEKRNKWERVQELAKSDGEPSPAGGSE
jgi:hypothetical protein